MPAEVLRNNRRVELTDAGHIFLADARRLLRDSESSLRHVREVIDGTRGELRVAFVPGAIMTYLPAIFRQFREQFPNIDVKPHALSFARHAAALQSGSVDVAWTGRTLDPDLESRLILEELTLAAIPSWHRLAARSSIDVSELDTDVMILMSARVSPTLQQEFLALALSRGYRPERVEEADEEETVLGLVASGFGTALIPQSWSVMKIPNIVYRPIHPPHHLPQVLSWPKNRYSPVVRSFVEMALETVPRLIAEQDSHIADG